MALLAIIATLIAIGAIFALEYYRQTQSDAYQGMKFIDDLARQYKNDPYGGDTPEETLQLFIDALKSGDTDLAAKYFTLEQQERWLTNLRKIKEDNELDSLIDDLNSAKRSSDIAADSVQFSLVTPDNRVITVVNIVKTSSDKWKIVDF